MRAYRITIVLDGKRYTYNAVASDWLTAWNAAVDEFGIASLAVVKPV